MFLTLAGKRPSRVLEKAIHREVSRQMKDFLRWYTGWECGEWLLVARLLVSLPGTAGVGSCISCHTSTVQC